MSSAAGRSGTAVVVAAYDKLPLARATARTASATGEVSCLVIDLDGAYRPVADEQVVSFPAAVARLGLRDEAVAAAATLEPGDLEFYAGVIGASYAAGDGADGVLVLGAGVHVLGELRPVLDEVGAAAVLPLADTASALKRAELASIKPGRAPESGSLANPTGPLYNRALYAVRSADEIAVLRGLAASWPVAGSALDVFSVSVAATVLTSPSVLLSPWRGVPRTHVDDGGQLCIEGSRVRAVDLTAFDHHRPWVLDAQARTNPPVLLSEHPGLAATAQEEARSRRDDEEALLGDAEHDALESPSRLRVDSILRAEARRAERANGELPDVLGLGSGPDVVSWALDLVPEGDRAPVARYLAAVRLARPHLRQTFGEVPGPDSSGLARWAHQKGARDGLLDVDLLTRAADVTLAAGSTSAAPAREGPRPQGVNLIGYLGGLLGIGESGRLMDDALQSAGVPTSTFDVGRDIDSRQGATYRQSEPVLYDTSLICVNAVDTPAVAARVRSVIEPTRVIGMWYWELEDFPPAHEAGFKHVDEVWTATDFIRDAVAKHAGDVPVRTVMPPLPQAGDDPGVLPERFGIAEDRQWFLFTFDFLSLAPRKNPDGLVEAFTRAFGGLPTEKRPLLVLKAINADRAPAHAERLRLQIAGRADVLFIDEYLEHHERHVLVAHCSAYVSLHKAEGLGLTVAEAMAWGKPVITTAYGGVMQFCDERNSFLVDWTRGYVEETVGPYAKGLPWAEPDVDQAAEYMRIVVEDPARAAAIGTQAADDIRELHNVEVAGARMHQVLGQGDAEWQVKCEEARARRKEQGPEPREVDKRSPEGRAKVHRRLQSWRRPRA